MLIITNKELCSGCYSCVNICPKNCISMKIDNEGFWYPEINKLKCINCGLCENKCPILNNMASNNIPTSYACINLDEKIRKDSSSGGIFTLLAKKIIDQGGIVFGAAFNNSFEVEHIEIHHVEDLYKLRGSKYVQSRLGNCYSRIKELLNNNILVYFSGTPCQIDGLLCYLDKEYENLFCQDIICHGVPSPQLWKEYIYQFNLDNETKINFRDKSTGWTTYSFTINQKEKFSQLHSENNYMKAFLNNLCLRPSCYNCHSKSIHRNSDITLADFWGINKIDKKMYDNKGTSLVFVNSKKGRRLFDSILPYIKYKQYDIEEALKYNLSAYKSVKIPQNRNVFFEELFCNNINTIINRYCRTSLKTKIKNFFITVMSYFN